MHAEVDVQFEQSSYEVMEGDSATVCVLVSGSLEKDLVVEVTSETDTAHGERIRFSNYFFKLNKDC